MNDVFLDPTGRGRASRAGTARDGSAAELRGGAIAPGQSLGWLRGEGEMVERIRTFDWGHHPLGRPETWPKNLSTALSICLASRFPILLWWGPELRLLYNDGYRVILGDKHPGVLGQRGIDAWSEIWDVIGPMLEQVLQQGRSTWSDDQLLFLRRFGYAEETYFTWSYSPIHNESGGVDGAFATVFETTGRVLGQRRLLTLRELGTNATAAKTVQEACARFVQTLEQSSADVPFALVYLLEEDGQTLVERGAVRVPEGHSARPVQMRLNDVIEGPWPARDALNELVVIADLESRFGSLSGGRWPEPSQTGVALPIPGTDAARPAGILIAGVNTRHALNDEYETFYQLVAGQLGTALSNARSYERERQRAEALAELDRAKTAFFSNVSHEFRTPLTLMLGPLEELLNRAEALPTPDIHQQLAVVHRNSLRLLKLVNSLLDFSRIEAGRLQAKYEPVELGTLTTDLASAFRSVMEKGGLRFEVHCPPLSDRVWVDRDMWEKIVFNLLSNAFKFTFTGSVKIQLQSDRGDAVLQVIDTGNGIPTDELPNLFKRFYRVQNVRARTHEGTGIGLALVQELVKLHGGSVAVESRSGEGSTFRVRLPMGRPPESAEATQTHLTRGSSLGGDQPFVDEALHWGPGDALRSLPVKPHAASEASRRARILVVDDNADMRDYVSRLLQDRYDLDTAADGLAALKMARRNPPDVILSDIMMPGSDGFALLAAIRQDPALGVIPVILLSARAGDEARVEGIQQGADDYLTKPFSGRELVARLETHLRLSRLRRESAMTERRLREEAQEIKRQLDAVLSSIEEQFIVLDAQCRYLYVNDRVLDVTGKGREQLLGQSLWDLFPEVKSTAFHAALLNAQADQRPVQCEVFYPPLGRWFDNRIYPTAQGLTILAADITERKRVEETLRVTQAELLHTNQELEQRVQQRTASLSEAIAQMEEFSYTVSHDLRAPLRGMQAYSEALLEDFELPPAAGQYLNRIAANARRLDKMILDVLTFSRIAREEIRLEPVDLHRLVRYIAEQYPGLQEPEARIELGRLEPVLGHEPSLTQAIANLLNNAVKFVAPAVTPHVRVWTERREGWVRLWVADNGIGIDPKFHYRLFRMFERVHPDQKYEGTGVGLAIIRKAAERVGGRAGLESDGKTGSRFWIELKPVAESSHSR